MEIRPEHPGDVNAIRSVTTKAFRNMAHSSGTEAAIIDALRAADALTISFVAIDGGRIVGHVAFSAVTIDGEDIGWYGLGPVSVSPECQRQGVGQALIREGLAELRRHGAAGCVVLGDPAYYGRFGFESNPGLRYGGVPPEYFQRLVFTGAAPKGEVAFHSGFAAT